MSKGSGGTRSKGPNGIGKQSEIPEAAKRIMDIINSEGEYDQRKYGSANSAHQFMIREDSPMTDEQHASVVYYQGHGYLPLQRYLSHRDDPSYSLSEKMEAHIKNLDAAMKPLPKDVIVYRAGREHEGASVGYTSTTIWVEYAGTYMYKENAKVRAYKIPAGTPAIRRFREQELIFPRNFNLNKYYIK